MNTERLLKAAEALEADANNPTGIKFDLHQWAKDSRHEGMWVEGHDPLAYSPDTKVIPVDCQTAACAMGLLALNHTFDGLGWIIDGGYMIPTYAGKQGFSAAEALFDITYEEADYLFTAERYKVRKGKEAELTVANRIREFVASGVTED